MVEFKSPLANKKFATQNMREVDVSDDSGDYSTPTQNIPFDQEAMRDFQARMQPQAQVRNLGEVEKEIHEAKIARRQGKERLSDGAKRRIEILIGMTRLSKSVDIDGNVYVLQTLKSKELRDAIVASAEFDGTVQFSFETGKQILARSLTQIAGVDIDQFINSNELEDKLNFVEDLDQALFSRLYNEYNLLNIEAQNKYAIKNPENAKEVVEDLKK